MQSTNGLQNEVLVSSMITFSCTEDYDTQDMGGNRIIILIMGLYLFFALGLAFFAEVGLNPRLYGPGIHCSRYLTLSGKTFTHNLSR